MFKTIKSKILLITCVMLFSILVVFATFMYLYYREAKSVIIWNCSGQISTLIQNVSKEIIKLENNAKDLALIGELYYNNNRNSNFINTAVTDIFKNYPHTLGGGIWFKPYYFLKNKRLSCIYVFRNYDGDILIDRVFETDNYDYPNKDWYTKIISSLDRKHDVVWSLPYYEKEGSDSLMITAGSGIYDKNNKLVGLSTVDYSLTKFSDIITDIKPTPNSFALFANTKQDYIIISNDKYLDNKNLIGKSLKNIPWYNTNLKNITYFTYHDTIYIPYVKNLDYGMTVIINVPKKELFHKIVFHVVFLCIFLFILSIFISIILYIVLKNNVIKPIKKLVNIADKISHGSTDLEIKIEKPQEFVQLAKTFDKMTIDLKNITKEKERINLELSIAKSIQESSLPSVFPPFPNRKEFDIFATMTTAKEVGGDFYDFFFIDEDNFMFLIADVSGKGIPAALFMMDVKSLINNISRPNLSPKKLIEEINKKIFTNNKNNLFVTMFAAIINLKTGIMSCINCGHNPPILKSSNTLFNYLKLEPNIALGVIDDFDFNIHEIFLKPGDIIFAYTDGITEAMNAENELYSSNRLLSCLNEIDDDSNDINKIINLISNDVNLFTNNFEQSDDQTMLIFKFNCLSSSDDIFTFKCLASIDYYNKFYTWLNLKCKKWNLNDSFINKIDMCAEELFANIIFYAYPDKRGDIEVSLSKNRNSIIMQFTDSGIPYNPLEAAEPNINLPPEERPLGGLGIYMLKKISNEVIYLRANGNNILNVKFYL